MSYLCFGEKKTKFYLLCSEVCLEEVGKLSCESESLLGHLIRVILIRSMPCNRRTPPPDRLEGFVWRWGSGVKNTHNTHSKVDAWRFDHSFIVEAIPLLLRLPAPASWALSEVCAHCSPPQLQAASKARPTTHA